MLAHTRMHARTHAHTYVHVHECTRTPIQWRSAQSSVDDAFGGLKNTSTCDYIEFNIDKWTMRAGRPVFSYL